MDKGDRKVKYKVLESSEIPEKNKRNTSKIFNRGKGINL